MLEKYKAIPVFINAVLALIVTITVGVTGAINYFATQKEFEKSRCEVKYDIDALSIQTVNLSLETNYVDTRRNLLLFEDRLKTEPVSANLKFAIDEARVKLENFRSRQVENDQKIAALAREKEEC